MRALLHGLIDMHVHGSPSIAPRVETWGFLKEMDDAGYRACCLKEHFIPTTGIAYIVKHAPCAPKTELMSSVVLNNSLGGLNITAVDTALALGARQVFMPTVSAANHLEYLKTVTKFGGGKLSLPERPICLLGVDGQLTSEAKAVADFMTAHKDVVLSMGHVSPAEIDAFLGYAVSLGLTKLIVDHPYFILGAAIEDVKRWAGMGVYINFTASSLEGIGGNGHVPVSILKRTLEEVPSDHLVITTDFGQPYNGSPVEGMYRMISFMVKELKVSEETVHLMTHETPAYLLGLSD